MEKNLPPAKVGPASNGEEREKIAMPPPKPQRKGYGCKKSTAGKTGSRTPRPPTTMEEAIAECQRKGEEMVLIPIVVEEGGEKKEEAKGKEGGMTSTPAEGGRGGDLRFNFELKAEEGAIGSPAMSPVSIVTKSTSSGEASADEGEGSSKSGGTAPYTPSESPSPEERKAKDDPKAAEVKEDTETAESEATSSISQTTSADTEADPPKGEDRKLGVKEEISSTQEGGGEGECSTEESDTEKEDEIFWAGESLRYVIEEIRKGHGMVEDGDGEPTLKAEAAIKAAMARERRDQERRGADSGFGMADEQEREWQEHGIQHFEANKIGELLDADAREWRRERLMRGEGREAQLKKTEETLEAVERGRRAMRMWGGWLDGIKKPERQEGAKKFNESVELVQTALKSAGEALEEAETSMEECIANLKKKGGETEVEKKLDESLKLWERGRKRSVAMVLEPHMRDLLRETEERGEREEEGEDYSGDNVKIKGERTDDAKIEDEQEDSSEEEEGFKTGDERMDVDEEEEKKEEGK